MLNKRDPRTALNHIVNDNCGDEVNAPFFFNRPTLYESVMDFLDRYEQNAIGSISTVEDSWRSTASGILGRGRHISGPAGAKGKV